ncbi:beta-lactamase domain-containing protein [Sphaerotilus natans subsp. natans DSM 6575]|uniref:Beta-lactamase domain-containing protein n=1 Tax=Sphaerotilus natans subsp. natans DSM 6575 TaxID=1286631 RepID=A0A059KRF4_9BURK|nr:MBL fold metallo-hydrolase [Sphaerotilus natans]KDB53693.1 beta-lactamase domain-containing protein [Sphaerotilus natans subsp. natans DSM 6575]SIQ43598.1 Glyoxylase, beta-lactamase superfamily II [Sphaerotilus natans]
MTLPTHTTDLGHGIFAIDTGFERENFDAAYLIVDAGRAAFIDTGHNAAVPRLLEALDALGLPREAVDWVIPTHVHLDHAGGAGLLMRHLPVARALIHPRGARHLIDPAALVEGARAVYGDEVMRQTYGVIEPIEAERVVDSHDGLRIQLGSRELLLIDTPGHARHHHGIWDERSRGWFTGDTFGISYREFDSADGAWIFPSTTPVQFEPEALRTSVQRMMAMQPQCLYPTHFGRVDGVERLAAQFLATLDRLEADGLALLARLPDDAPARLAALKEQVAATLVASALAAGSPVSAERARELLALDIDLNAQGMAVWLSRVVRTP